jgi:hypothetical protein
LKLATMPRAVRRKVMQLAVSDPANIPSIRADLASLKAKREEALALIQRMDEAIQDCQALLGELEA